MYRVEVGGNNYVAQDLATLQQWVREGRVLADTIVWVEMENVQKPARQVTGLVFAEPHQPNFSQPPGYGQGTYLRQNSPPPPNHLVWAILATILCCMPLGVVSLIFAAQVDSLHASGETEKALNASNKAKTWAIVSVCSGFVVSILYIVLMVAAGGLN